MQSNANAGVFDDRVQGNLEVGVRVLYVVFLEVLWQMQHGQILPGASGRLLYDRGSRVLNEW